MDTSVLLRCHLRLLERQVYSVARFFPDLSFLSLCHRCCVAGLSMLHKVNANSNHCLFSELLLEFDIPKLRLQLIHCSLRCQGVERPYLQGISCRPRFECWMTFPALCLTLERWMGSSVQSTVGCFPELCFLQFSVVQVLVGLWNQFINNFVFPARAVLLFKIIITVSGSVGFKKCKAADYCALYVHV